MSLDEKLALSNKAIALKEAGDRAGHDRLMNMIPMPPYLVKIAKEKIGLDFVLSSGWNLSEAEAEFGSDWFSK
jgi:hypothetical protein